MSPQVKKYSWLVIIIMVIAGSALFVYQRTADSGVLEETEERVEIPEVRVTPVTRGNIAQRSWMTGEIAADKTVEIIPRVTARLKRMRHADGSLIEEGTVVQEGDNIAVLEHQDLDAAVQSARAAYETAQASYEMARVIQADAEREMNRWIRLREEGVGTQQAYDQAVTAHERAKAEGAVAESRIEQSRAALNQATVNYNEAWIKAPFTGIVSRKYVHEGAFVGPGTPLLRLVNIDQVEITAGLAGKYYSMVQAGQTQVEVRIDAFPDKKFTGTVSRVRPELDQRTRTAVITINIPNNDHLLKPGMYARIELILIEKSGVLIVPDSAIIDPMGDSRIYLIRDETVRIKPVKTGLREDSFLEVLEGVEEGDLAILSGHQLLQEGMQVTPRKERVTQ